MFIDKNTDFARDVIASIERKGVVNLCLNPLKIQIIDNRLIKICAENISFFY